MKIKVHRDVRNSKSGNMTSSGESPCSYSVRGFYMTNASNKWDRTSVALVDGPCPNLLRGDKVLILVPSDC